MRIVKPRKLKRSDCAILPLVLEGIWYRRIESGWKKEEYRDASDYWRKRINNWSWKADEGKEYVIEFRHGYGKNAPRMAFVCRLIVIRGGDSIFPRMHPEWGEPTTEHFVLGLGERVELEGGLE